MTADHVPPPGTIVVGVDGSAESDLAVRWAAEQAALEGRAVSLVHGVGLGNGGWGDFYGLGNQSVIEARRSQGQDLLDAAEILSHNIAPEARTRTFLELADPRLALLELAERAALVVVGARGKGPVARLLLGSVSMALTRHAPCPVVVLRPEQPAGEGRGVLVGVDGRGASTTALEFAFRHASLRSLPLTVLHCFDVGAATGVEILAYDSPGLEDERLVLDETVAGMGEKFSDVPLTLALARGPSDDCLVAASKEMDLLVVGAHPRQTLIGLVLDPHVDRAMAERSPVAVAVVPEPAES